MTSELIRRISECAQMLQIVKPKKPTITKFHTFDFRLNKSKSKINLVARRQIQFYDSINLTAHTHTHPNTYIFEKCMRSGKKYIGYNK